MRSPTSILIKEFRTSGLMTSMEYLIFLKTIKAIKLENKQVSMSEPNIEETFLTKITNIFSSKKQMERRAAQIMLPNIMSNTNKSINDLDVSKILGENINDEIIDLEFIEKYFQGSNLNEMLNNISIEKRDNFLSVIENFREESIKTFIALNSDKVDDKFLKEKFVSYYQKSNDFSSELRGQKIRLDVLMFQQAFNKNPEKFSNLEELIPVNLACSVDVVGVAEPKIVCHSIGGKLTADSLKFAHEILIARAASAQLNARIFVMLDQQDEEVFSVLQHFTEVGKNPQKHCDLAILDEDYMTYSEWDIKNQYMKLNLSKKFAQQIIQKGSYKNNSLEKEDEARYMSSVFEALEKKINDKSLSIEEKIRFLKKHNELVSYVITGESIYLLPCGDKNLFVAIKLFLNLSSYVQKIKT